MSGYHPALYALVHCGNEGDAAFYERAVAGAASVLELGCGFGRLIPTLLQGGARYVGIDVDGGLLALATRVKRSLPRPLAARVTLREADMRTFRLPQRFDRIVIPHSGLLCLQNDGDVLQCLTRAREQLADHGELLLDVYNADDFHEALDESSMTGKERDWVASVSTGETQYEVFERTRWHKAKQQLVVTYEYVTESGIAHKGRIDHRYLLRAQLEALLAEAGLSPTLVAGSFKGTRYTRRSDHLVIRAVCT